MQDQSSPQELDKITNEKSAKLPNNIITSKTFILLGIFAIVFALGVYSSDIISKKNISYSEWVEMNKISYEEWKEINKKDGNKWYRVINDIVYYNTSPTTLDPTNFRDLGERWGANDKQIFIEGREVRLDLDPKKIVVVNKDALKDDEKVYFFSINYNGDPEIISVPNVDASSFSFLGQCSHVFYTELNYYKDRNYVYVNDKVIEGADPNSFKFLGEYGRWGYGDGSSSGGYAMDGKSVYFDCDKKITGADPESFVRVGNLIGKDENNVWFRDALIVGADSKTFKQIKEGGEYYEDKTNVYYVDDKVNILKVVDRPTFQVLTRQYAKDKNNVYMAGEINYFSSETDRGTTKVKVDPGKCTLESIKESDEKMWDTCGPIPEWY